MAENCYVLNPTADFMAQELPDRIMARFRELSGELVPFMRESQGRVPVEQPSMGYEVGKLLAATSNKDEKLEDILGGFSVNDLLALNAWTVPGDCNGAELDRRSSTCSKLEGFMPAHNMYDQAVKNGLLDYCFSVLDRTRRSCVENTLRELGDDVHLFSEFELTMRTYLYGAARDDPTGSYDQAKAVRSALASMDRQQANKMKLACSKLTGNPRVHYFTVMNTTFQNYYRYCEELFPKGWLPRLW